jgi:hypothetical protein
MSRKDMMAIVSFFQCNGVELFFSRFSPGLDFFFVTFFCIKAKESKAWQKQLAEINEIKISLP